MTADEFFRLVEQDLQLRHVPFDARELREFCRSMFPLSTAADSWEWWATEFLATRREQAEAEAK